MKTKDYMTTTFNEYFESGTKNETVFAIPKKALVDVCKTKNSQERSVLLNNILKKYLINTKRAQTNARILEAFLG